MHPADPKDQRIAELERLVAQLIAENRELRARLDMNSSNSSKPPSSDGPGVSRGEKPKTGRSRGGQPGHKGNKRSLLPPDKVNKFVDSRPSNCGRCDRPLEGDDPYPRRRQIIELPPVAPQVTEIRYHALCCPDCGVVTRAPEPPGLPRGAFGPRLLSIVTLLTGKFGVSKRGAREFLSDVLGVDLAVGSISKAEAIVSESIAPAVEEARAYVRTQHSANLDETGWREAAQRAWLWIATTALVAVFTISRSRGSQVAKELVGEDFEGIVSSDRWSAYTWLPLEQRQICWAHLKRDFKALSEFDGPGASIGAALLTETERMFEWWARVRDGTLRRDEFQRRMRAVKREVGDLLVEGEVCPDGKVAGICHKILSVEPALWTFVDVEGIEPTNNLAERDLRRAVLWRKSCFGTDSETGSRYAERILTITKTLRKQNRHVLEFLTQSVEASIRGAPGPSLLPSMRAAEAAA